MERIKKKIRYIYWLGANVQYRYFGERGDNGIYIITMLIITVLLNIFAFFRVLFYGHVSLGDTTVIEKLAVVVTVLLIYHIISKSFIGIPIKDNEEFKHVSKNKRIFHTVLLYAFWAFLFYVFLVIMSPTFHPRQLKFW
jgi:hypothetical protein